MGITYINNNGTKKLTMKTDINSRCSVKLWVMTWDPLIMYIILRISTSMPVTSVSPVNITVCESARAGVGVNRCGRRQVNRVVEIIGRRPGRPWRRWL